MLSRQVIYESDVWEAAEFSELHCSDLLIKSANGVQSCF